MNVTIYIDFELSKFIKDINKNKKWNVDYNCFKPRYKLSDIYRCLGRIWDKENWDINKQCKNKTYKDEIICRRCLDRKTICGLVNECPDEERILYWYRRGLLHKKKKYPGNIELQLRDIDKEINLTCFNKLIIKTPKKISNNNVKKMKLSISKNTDTLNKTNSNLDWWNSVLTNKINIVDVYNGASFTFAMENNSTGFLFNKNKVILGNFGEWEDIDNKIPKCFKNKHNQVLDPNTAVPIYEYILHENGSLYHDLDKGIYREYRYDEDKEELIFTNCIEYK